MDLLSDVFLCGPTMRTTAPEDEASDDEFHMESCSPESPFVIRDGQRRLRRTFSVMMEEARVSNLVQQFQAPRQREADSETWSPIHVAAQQGDSRALCFLLLCGADPHETTGTGSSAWDLAMAHNRRGSHDEVMAMLESRSEPGWEDRLLAQWRQ
eukprot:g1199.t1